MFKYYLSQQDLKKKFEKVVITTKFTLCRTPLILKIDVFGIPDNQNQNLGKLFSKYELLFLDQVNSSFDPS